MRDRIIYYLFHPLVLGGARVMTVNMAGMALAYLVHLLLANWLGVSQYGYYVYALAWLNILTILMQLGMNTSTERLASTLRAQNRPAAILGLSWFSTQVVMVTGLVVMAVGGMLLVLMADAMARAQVLTLAIMLPLAVLLSLLYQRIALLRGFEKVAVAQSFLEIFRPLVLIACITLMARLFDLAAHWAMVANLIATSVALLLAAAFVWRFLDSREGKVIRETDTRAWLAISLHYLGLGLLATIIAQSDILMLGTLLDGDAAGLYSPAVKLAMLCVLPMMAVQSRIAPTLTRLYARNKLREIQHHINIATIISVFSGLVLVGLVVWQRDFLLGLFGPEYTAAAFSVAVLCAGIAFYTLTGNIEILLIMGPFERTALAVYALVVGLNITLNLILIPWLGYIGAAYATAATFIVRGAVSVWVIWKRTGILPWAMLAPAGGQAETP